MLFHYSLLLLIAIWDLPDLVLSQCPHEAEDLVAWSDAAAWGDNGVPQTNSTVTIDFAVLLDVETPDLWSVTIADGGRLVFDPLEDQVRLTSHAILIDGGEMWIGSELCPFTGSAEVELIGKSGEHPGFLGNEKVLLVKEGALEVHGEHKRSWTRLDGTVHRSDREDIIGEPLVDAGPGSDQTRKGFFGVEFDADGSLVRNWGRFSSPRKFARLESHTGNIVVFAVHNAVRFGRNSPANFSAAFESLCYGEVSSTSAMANMVNMQSTAWVAICHIGSPADSIEELGQEVNALSRTSRLIRTIGNATFLAQAAIDVSKSRSESTNILSYTPDNVPIMERVVSLADDVSTWSVGDKIVLASTDYNWKQAEEFTLLECEECTSHQVKIAGIVFYTHWGEISSGVDMRAEVGLLNRNIRFYGRMEDACYGDNDCDHYSYDTFGGHVKMLRDFTSARIENAEFTQMGQQVVVGSYPIHFHMCLDTSSKDAYVRNNVIHHTFLRCVTVHGSHNVTVEANTGYDHLGHCYFVEDGGEQDNRFIGNLGLGTRPGTLLPSDVKGKTSTFWISNPDNELVGNAAAGSDGIGIWILMAKLPTGPSANVDMGLVSGQASRTAVKLFEDNSVHSNFKTGFRLDDELKPDGTTPPTQYYPRQDPADPNSDDFELALTRLTAYKNAECVWIKSQWTISSEFHLSDCVQGFTYASAKPALRGAKAQVLENSIFVGDSDNKGKPAGTITLSSGESVTLDRSYPFTGTLMERAQVGMLFYRGPVHVRDTTFDMFTANIVRPSAAVGKKGSNPYFSATINSVRNVTFLDSDEVETVRFYDGVGTVPGFAEKDGNRHNVLQDWDGSLTGSCLYSIVRPLPVHLNARCSIIPAWGPGTAVCQDPFTRIKLDGAGQTPTFITRNDLQDAETEAARGDAQISYALNSLESYILHFNSTVPRAFALSPYSVEAGVSMFLGVCIGVDQQFQLRENRYQSAATVEEVQQDDTNSLYFYDSEAGLLFFRFSNEYPRLETTSTMCPGTEEGNGICDMFVRIQLEASNDDGDCRNRAYPKYSTIPITA